MIKIIINEQHKLTPQQHKIIEETFPQQNWEFLKIPAKGLTLKEINDLVYSLFENSTFGDKIIIVSPIPYMIAAIVSITWSRYVNDGISFGAGPRFFLFHNDKREKVEKDGKVFYKVLDESWELISI